MRLILRPRVILFILSVFFITACVQEKDQKLNGNYLHSWNEGTAKTIIMNYVNEATDSNSTNYITPADRIAVFDNDGTLWSEKPFYFQLQFTIDRIKEMVKLHPEWKTKQPFQAVFEDDWETLMASGVPGLMQILLASHTGMTATEFEKIVTDWIATARHPKTGKLYKEMVFQPMLEVLKYLKANGFKTYIVSGGGIEFMRPWTQDVYGIPPEQVIGSSIKVKFEMREDGPVLMRLPEIDFINDKEGKPVGIYKSIGKKPVIAFGNSDGDLQMLQWTDSNPKKSLKVLIHHTDAQREWAYDRNSHIGKLDKALDEAAEKNWLVVDMEKDWGKIYPWSE